MWSKDDGETVSARSRPLPHPVNGLNPTNGCVKRLPGGCRAAYSIICRRQTISLEATGNAPLAASLLIVPCRHMTVSDKQHLANMITTSKYLMSSHSA